MAHVKWADNLLLSVPELDQDHMRLIAEADEFCGAVESDAGRAQLEARLKRLIEHFAGHFAAEEKLMRAAEYPGAPGHTAEHRRLLQQFGDFQHLVDSGTASLCGALGHFVQRWTEQHIAGADAAFARYYRSRLGQGSPADCARAR